MKWIIYYIYSMVIFGVGYLIRFILSAILGLFMASPDMLSTILAIIITFGLSIWYIDWNMKR
jgi:hypothetical protein